MITELSTDDAAAPPQGVLPSQWLRKAIESRWIEGVSHPERVLQPASLDLRLGPKAYRLRCSFLPDKSPVEEKLRDLSMGELDLRSGAILERNTPYLVPLVERLRLPEDIRGRANPKSSTGRLDVFTRVISDCSPQFDDVRAGYAGGLYLEIVSRSFTVRVEAGLSLNQIRLSRGGSLVSDAELRVAHTDDTLLFDERYEPVPTADLPVGGGLFLSLDLSGDDNEVVGYRAKKNSKLVDMTLVSSHDPSEYWEPVVRERRGRIVLEPEEFYLLLSAEAVRVAPQFAAEMTPYDPTSGELRTHYAGFFDPGFGAGPAMSGSRAALEVRAHDVPFMVEHGQRVCKLVFERLIEEPAALYGETGSHYQGQRGVLGKHFWAPGPSTQLVLGDLLR